MQAGIHASAFRGCRVFNRLRLRRRLLAPVFRYSIAGDTAYRWLGSQPATCPKMRNNDDVSKPVLAPPDSWLCASENPAAVVMQRSGTNDDAGRLRSEVGSLPAGIDPAENVDIILT